MVGLVYNTFGPRIVEAGSVQGGNVIAPDVFDMPQHLLDLIATWRVIGARQARVQVEEHRVREAQYKQGDEITFSSTGARV